MMQGLLFERIRREVQSNDVVLYMKGTAVFPQCGFSAAMVQVLTQLGIPFKEVNILRDRDLHQGLKAYADWPMLPQLYVKGEFVGGCDVIRDMYEQGELLDFFIETGLMSEQDVA